MSYRWVSFTTDYGTLDGFVAAVKGVIAGIAPDVTVIDVTHHVPAQDVRRGAAVLAQTAPWLPPAVHLAVVDPGVGTRRRGIAVVASRGVLVGPDNGLLLPAADALGGMTGAYELVDPAYRLAEVSATFHGRDVFGPAAAHLCLGLDPARLGPPVADPVRLAEPIVHLGPGEVLAEVLSVDGFGNVQLAATELGGLTGTVRVQDGLATVGRTFADVPDGELIVLADSAGYVTIAVNRGDAAARLGVQPGDIVEIRSTRLTNGAP
jgi:S-adenosyl-L-methionine hydrolase (adenosine-forming)